MRTMRKLAVIVHDIEKGEWDLVMLKNMMLQKAGNINEDGYDCI